MRIRGSHYPTYSEARYFRLRKKSPRSAFRMYGILNGLLRITFGIWCCLGIGYMAMLGSNHTSTLHDHPQSREPSSSFCGPATPKPLSSQFSTRKTLFLVLSAFRFAITLVIPIITFLEKQSIAAPWIYCAHPYSTIFHLANDPRQR